MNRWLWCLIFWFPLVSGVYLCGTWAGKQFPFLVTFPQLMLTTFMFETTSKRWLAPLVHLIWCAWHVVVCSPAMLAFGIPIRFVLVSLNLINVIVFANPIDFIVFGATPVTWSDKPPQSRFFYCFLHVFWNPPLMIAVHFSHWIGENVFEPLATIIDDDVVLGSLPANERDAQLLYQEPYNVRHVINMCDETHGPVLSYDKYGMTYDNFPTLDLTSPTFANLKRGVSVMEAFVANKAPRERIFVHCKAGQGRSASLVLCYLVRQGMSMDDALRLLKSKRKQVSAGYIKRMRGVTQFVDPKESESKKSRGQGIGSSMSVSLLLMLVTVAAAALFVGDADFEFGFSRGAHELESARKFVFSTADHVNPMLDDHTKLFNKAEVLTVIDGVHVAIGFGLANSILIEGEKGLILIDAMESVPAARRVKEAFEAVVSDKTKKIRNVIYTHYHPDHTLGVKGFVDFEDDEQGRKVDVWAHRTSLKQFERLLSVVSGITDIRGKRQFGAVLSKLKTKNCRQHTAHAPDCEPSSFWSSNTSFINSGIGPSLEIARDTEISIVFPNKFFELDDQTVTMDGVTFQVVHAPGETDDQIFLYMVKERVLFPADNIYEAFPNIYAIRGSPTRNARNWANSLDKMRRLEPFPTLMVPCHTRPVRGSQVIYDTLTVYRDGITFVHDQTARFMNKGWYPQQIAKKVMMDMPERLRTHPYLQEYYGTVEWSSRAIFTGYLGWFSGDPVDLFPLTESQKALHWTAFLRWIAHQDQDQKEKEKDNHFTTLVRFANRLMDIGDDGNSNSKPKPKPKRDDIQFGLRLCTLVTRAHQDYHEFGLKNMVVVNDLPAKRDLLDALSCRWKGMKLLSTFCKSANCRNYYLTKTYEESHESTYQSKPARHMINTFLDSVSLETIFVKILPSRYKFDEMKPSYRNMTVIFAISPRTGKAKAEAEAEAYDDLFVIEFRDGIVEVTVDRKVYHTEHHVTELKAYVKEAHDSARFVVKCNEEVYRRLLTTESVVDRVQAFAKDMTVVRGSLIIVGQFADFFERR